ncbi:Integral membrane protein [Trichophyton interdigitale]|uniref:Integral membrane protein n=1 Tax=Trichophyton interdigitale TaxID=101480 RepID=A0A9P4YKW6_9EURO|nr:Integral membrane protein [Trichophyton interdigitale]KAF3900434.1 Integral membrane protein [Trichophyton interdigitale]KAG8211229.1 Integral membrane protein [Trichophyton interdigitale]
MMEFPPGGVIVIVINTIFTALAIIAVILRFYAIHVIGRNYYMSDYLIVLGLIFTIATAALAMISAIDGGAGLHMNQATDRQLLLLLKTFVAGPIIWSTATTFIKLSILSFYHKVFGSKQSMRIAVYIESIITIALYLAGVLEPFLLCRPFNYTWNKDAHGTCGNATKAYLAVAVANLIVDLSIYLLPIPVLWNLQMNLVKRLALCGIFAIGLLVCIFSGLRIYAVLTLDVNDYSYSMIKDVTFAGLEVELGAINACLPFYRPLVAKYIPSLKFDRNSSGRSYSSAKSRPGQVPCSNEGGSRDSRGSQNPLNPPRCNPYVDEVVGEPYARRDGNGQLDDSSLEKGITQEQRAASR